MAPSRDPEFTRNHIVEVAAVEFWKKGYQSTSLADILDKAGVSKGALYHHFKNKLELGYAVFDEVFTPKFFEKWEFDVSDDPITALCTRFNEIASWVDEDTLRLGCPVTNIALEMAVCDEGFRQKSSVMYAQLSVKFSKLLAEAADKGIVDKNIDSDAVATFVTAAIQGMKLQGKYVRSLDLFKSSIYAIASYLESLRVVK